MLNEWSFYLPYLLFLYIKKQLPETMFTARSPVLLCRWFFGSVGILSSSSSSSKQPPEGMQCAQSFIISFSIYMYKPYRVFHADASNCPGSTAVFVYFVRMKVIIKCYLAHHTNVLVPSTLCGNLKEIYRYLKFDR